MSKNTRIYWYDYLDINNLLKSKSNNGLYYYVTETASQSNEQALQRINEAFTSLEENTELIAAVVPINLGHSINGVYEGSHWVGMVIRHNQETYNLEVFYNDSLGISMDVSLPNLRQILNNHGVSNERITDFKQKQQDNGFDCGAWTVLNLDSLARSGTLPEATENDVINQRRDAFGYTPNSHGLEDTVITGSKAVATSARGGEFKEDNNTYDIHKQSQLVHGLTYEFESKRGEALTKIQSSYQIGLKYYQENNLELAEQEFAKVLRPVLSKPLMKNLYVNVSDCKEELLDAMYHLGQIYLASDRYSEHHAKAAGIFQYCERFTKEHGVKLHYDNGEEINFLSDAYFTEEQFLTTLSADSNSSRSSDATTMEDCYHQHQQEVDGKNGYKQGLKGTKSQVKKDLVEINKLTVERIGDRARADEALYKDCTAFFVNNNSDKVDNPGFIQKLLQSCFSKLGNPPVGCDYSIIGLGSLASGKMTPWSDLEFAVLINEDEINEDKYKEYFRNLIKLLRIKVVNLGETPLRSLGVEALNNFRTANEEDDWFWDDLTSSGFSFDGPDWHACKTPLGRQGGYKALKKTKLENGTEEIRIIDKSDYELILTPKQMAAFQKEQAIKYVKATSSVQSMSEASCIDDISEESWFKSDMHLVQALRTVVLIDGSQTLLDDYRQELRVIDAEDPQIIKSRALEKLKEDLASFSLKLGDKEEGKLIDVKKNIFRIGDRIIEDLANYYGIGPEDGQPGLTAWEIIDKNG